MNNGFYFNDSNILSEYYLLQKLNLIQSQQLDDINSEKSDPYLYLNGQKYSFCSIFDLNSTADFIIIFSHLSAEILQQISSQTKQNQKILFIAHILYDYQTEYQTLSSHFGTSKIYILSDNEKNPFIIAMIDAKRLQMNPLIENEIISFNCSNIKIEKAQTGFNLTAIIRIFFYHVLKLFLKPGQFFKDLYATYNLRYFYGIMKMAVVKPFYIVRNLLIRMIMNCFYFCRHASKMSFVHIFYGLKIYLIRLFYFILSIIKFCFSKIYYIQILAIRGKALIQYLIGFLIWCYYRIQWCYYRIQWCYYRIQWLMHRLHEFNMKFTFYPFRKIYWFCQFQIGKIIRWNKNV